MSLCPQCGASSSDGALFCPSCGAPVVQSEADRTGNTAHLPTKDDRLPPEGIPRGPFYGDAPGEALPLPENIAGAVAYITIVPAIVFLLLEPFKRNLFVRFHAFQHLFLWVAGFVIAIAAGILAALLQLIPFMRVLVFPLGGLIGLAWFFLWVLLVVKAYQHEFFKLPIIGDLAEQRAGI
jgi:uncharacterized membrane protein